MVSSTIEGELGVARLLDNFFKKVGQGRACGLCIPHHLIAPHRTKPILAHSIQYILNTVL